MVVITHIFPRNETQMPFVHDEQMVEVLLTDGIHPSFRVGIGIGAQSGI